MAETSVALNPKINAIRYKSGYAKKKEKRALLRNQTRLAPKAPKANAFVQIEIPFLNSGKAVT